MTGHSHARAILIAAAAVACGIAHAQPALPPPSTDTQAALVEQILQVRASGGPTAAGAVEPLRALALQYQEAGDDAVAIALLEEARHVTRVHHGLSSAEEALLLLQQIRSEKALGADLRVWDHEQDMVTMARQHLDDIRMVPIFRGLAEDRAEVLRLYRGAHRPPEIELGCYYVDAPLPYADTRGARGLQPFGSCQAGNKLTVYRQLRTEILMYYADAIQVIVNNGDFASEELRDLEKAAVRFWTFPAAKINGPIETGVPPATVNGCEKTPLDELLALELRGTCLEPIIHDKGTVAPNVGGWVGLVRLIIYETRSGASAADRASAIARLADWHLQITPAERRHFGDGDKALALYRRAYRELQQGGDLPASTQQLFAPELPVVLPDLEPNPFATAPSARYIDVSFDITKHGIGQGIEILATSNGATRAEQRGLTRLITLSSFRPRMVDGVLAATTSVTVRYHLAP